MLFAFFRPTLAAALLLGAAALGISSTARADDPAEPPLPELPPPTLQAPMVAPDPAPAMDADPALDVPPPHVESRAQIWERKHRQNFEGGLMTAGASYALAAGMGAYVRLLDHEALTKTWGTFLFVPIGGPMYLGGRMLLSWSDTLGRHPSAASVALSPLAYGVGLFLMFDGVMQAYGLVRATGIGEGPRPGGRSSDPTRTLRNVWVAPSPSPNGGELHLGASF
ncbi:MAG: hypothetical protein HOO96_29325 [Polyangiaceae bacterium]|nr:hypothetical protein [Polyangiaceae bacterium]